MTLPISARSAETAWRGSGTGDLLAESSERLGQPDQRLVVGDGTVVEQCAGPGAIDAGAGPQQVGEQIAAWVRACPHPFTQAATRAGAELGGRRVAAVGP